MHYFPGVIDLMTFYLLYRGETTKAVVENMIAVLETKTNDINELIKSSILKKVFVK